MLDLKVYEINMLLYLLRDIEREKCPEEISNFIDSGMAKDEELLKLHKKNTFKMYNFNMFYPIEKRGSYLSGNIYSIQIRTIDKKLAEFFNNNLVNNFTDSIKGLKATIKIIPQKHIDRIYSITPAILKSDQGYWKGNLSLSDFERRLKENLVKKYNLAMETKIDEGFQLYTNIEFMNEKPVAMSYKCSKILGDKIQLSISDDKAAQDLAYMALGTGILEMNARGAGYVNFRFV